MSRDTPIVSVGIAQPGSGIEDVSHLIKDFTFEDDEKKKDKLTFSVDNFDLSLLGSPLFTKGNEVTFQFGYPGRMAPVRQAVIDKVKGVSKIQVVALDRGSLMHKQKLCRQFENVTRSSVARTIAQEYGFIDLTMLISDTKEVLEQVTQAAQTDAELLRDLADREGFDWYVDFDGFHFHARDLNQSPLRVLRYYHGAAEQEIISLSADTDVSSAKPGKVRLRGRNPITKEEIDVVAENATVTRVSLGALLEVVSPDETAGAPAAENVATEWVVHTTEPTAALAKRMADGIYKRAQLEGVGLGVTLKGDAWMVAKSIIILENVGAYSGPFYVKNVRSRVNGGSFTTAMKIKSDGKSADYTVTAFGAPQGRVKTKAAVNKKKKPAVEAPPASAAAGTPSAPPAPKPVDIIRGGRKITIYRDHHGREINP